MAGLAATCTTILQFISSRPVATGVGESARRGPSLTSDVVVERGGRGRLPGIVASSVREEPFPGERKDLRCAR